MFQMILHHAHVYLDLLDNHRVASQNVLAIVNVQVIWRASIKNAEIHALDHVRSMPNVA